MKESYQDNDPKYKSAIIKLTEIVVMTQVPSPDPVSVVI